MNYPTWRTKNSWWLGVLALGLLGAGGAVEARADVRVVIRSGSHCSPGYGYGYYRPAPVYYHYSPRPVCYYPRPVYYRPQPYYSRCAPVYHRPPHRSGCR